MRVHVSACEWGASEYEATADHWHEGLVPDAASSYIGLCYPFRVSAARGYCAREESGPLNAGVAWIRGRFRAGVFSLCNSGGTGPLPVIRGHELSCTASFLAEQACE